MAKLLPSTQAVLDAILEISPAPADEIAAVVLRTVAEIVAPLTYEDVWTDGRMLQYEKDDPIRKKLLAIADELETNY